MLNVISKDEAVASVKSKIRENGIVCPTEKTDFFDALGRVLAADVTANEDVPAFNRTTVDGYAVHASDTFGAGSAIPAQLEIAGEIAMGENADFTLEKGQCAKISTGGMLPRGADAAVMVEYTDCEEDIWYMYEDDTLYLYDEEEDVMCYYDEESDVIYYYDEDRDDWLEME